jgi:hypothetical protein
MVVSSGSLGDVGTRRASAPGDGVLVFIVQCNIMMRCTIVKGEAIRPLR